jgi:hypothetical protein
MAAKTIRRGRRRDAHAGALTARLLWCLLALLAHLGASCTCATVDSQLNTAAAVQYTRDDADYWQTPEETVRRGRGDCEDLAFYLHRLLRDEGIDSVVVFGIRDVTDPKAGHAWVECRMYGEVYVLDPTCRLLARRRALPYYMYYAVLRQPELTEKLRGYLRRTGERNVNPTFEAVIEAMARSQAGTGRKE